jgi:SnoaL-like domain
MTTRPTPSQSTTSAAPGIAAVDQVAMPLGPAARVTLAKWLAMLEKNDFGDLTSIIAADAVYHSPVEWHPYPGHDLVCLLVRTAAGVFEDFRYERQMAGGDSAMLEFSAHIGDIELKGAHLIRFNADGEIMDIDLIARPAKGVMALGNGVGDKIGPQIKAALAARKAGVTNTR